MVCCFCFLAFVFWCWVLGACFRCVLKSFTRCAFHIPGSQKFIDLELLVGEDDDLAVIQGRFTFATIVASVIRHMCLLSWPHGLVLLGSDDDNLVTTVVAQFHAEYLLYVALD